MSTRPAVLLALFWSSLLLLSCDAWDEAVYLENGSDQELTAHFWWLESGDSLAAQEVIPVSETRLLRSYTSSTALDKAIWLEGLTLTAEDAVVYTQDPIMEAAWEAETVSQGWMQTSTRTYTLVISEDSLSQER